MSKDTELLTEIRDLLLLIAEPALAKRDERLRNALRAIIGKSQKKANAVLLMDGSKSQTVIANEADIDQGQLSRLIKALTEASLLTTEERNPKLVIAVPARFFEEGSVSDERTTG